MDTISIPPRLIQELEAKAADLEHNLKDIRALVNQIREAIATKPSALPISTPTQTAIASRLHPNWSRAKNLVAMLGLDPSCNEGKNLIFQSLNRMEELAGNVPQFDEAKMLIFIEVILKEWAWLYHADLWNKYYPAISKSFAKMIKQEQIPQNAGDQIICQEWIAKIAVKRSLGDDAINTIGIDNEEF